MGCSPKYVIKNQYIPLMDANFAPCVSTCTLSKESCDATCDDNYQSCLNTAFDRAKEIYAVELFRYDRDYAYYLRELGKYNDIRYLIERKYSFLKRDYKYFSQQCSKTRDIYACDRQDIIRRNLYQMQRNMPRHPNKPLKPSLQHITNTEQNSCQNECGCSKSFDLCYTNCGGQVIPYKLCVENCE